VFLPIHSSHVGLRFLRELFLSNNSQRLHGMGSHVVVLEDIFFTDDDGTHGFAHCY
jgi:hypothetical protein